MFIALITFSCSVNSNELDNVNKLRTLFTSPDIRHQLDQLRNSGKYDSTNFSNSDKAPRQPIKIKAQGIVVREKKPAVIFLNNKSTIKSNKINNEITIGSTFLKNYTIPVKVNNKTISLLPGQTWQESDNKTVESYLIEHSPESAKINDIDSDKIIKHTE